jgi:hypothetical protein
VFQEPYVEVVPAGAVASDPATIKVFNLLTMTPDEQVCRSWLVVLEHHVLNTVALQDIVEAPFTLVVRPPTETEADSSAAPAPAQTSATSATPAQPDDGLVTVHGVVLWFDTAFEDTILPSLPAMPPPATAAPAASSRVYFSTGPAHTPTHWQQTVLPLQTPLRVTPATVLHGAIIDYP